MLSSRHLLASDVERERVAVHLRDAAAEGRLEPEELEERLDTAYRARTHGDLAALVADLPRLALAPRSESSRTLAHRARQVGTLTGRGLVLVSVWCLRIGVISARALTRALEFLLAELSDRRRQQVPVPRKRWGA